jgi:deoxyribose-phosphate aldolase
MNETSRRVEVNDIAQMMDYSLLKPSMTDDDIREGCRLAREYGVAALCVRPSDVPLVVELLKDSGVRPITVIGFPHGTTTTATKVAEAEEAVHNGAVEIDMVLNIGKLLSGDVVYVRNDIRAVTEAVHAAAARIKVIFETCFLSQQEIQTACEICNEVGVDFVKTSTGCGTRGASDTDLRLMRRFCNPGIEIKASGGILTLERALEVKKLGCTRFGCPSPVGILERLKGA